MSGGRKPREKGVRFEREVVSILKEHGIHAKRVPLSGATNFQKGDVVIETVEGSPIVVELKSRKNEFDKIYLAIEESKKYEVDAAELIFYDAKGVKQIFGPIIFMTLEKWIEIMTNFSQPAQLGVQGYDVGSGWISLGRNLEKYAKNVDMIIIKGDRKPALVGIMTERLYDVVSRTLAVDGITSEKYEEDEYDDDEFGDDE